MQGGQKVSRCRVINKFFVKFQCNRAKTEHLGLISIDNLVVFTFWAILYTRQGGGRCMYGCCCCRRCHRQTFTATPTRWARRSCVHATTATCVSTSSTLLSTQPSTVESNSTCCRSTTSSSITTCTASRTTSRAVLVSSSPRWRTPLAVSLLSVILQLLRRRSITLIGCKLLLVPARFATWSHLSDDLFDCFSTSLYGKSGHLNDALLDKRKTVSEGPRASPREKFLKSRWLWVKIEAFQADYAQRSWSLRTL